jgi:general secretion pathway protein L
LAETLFIRLVDGGAAAWAAFDANGGLAGRIGRGPLAGAAAALQGRRCCVLVPAVDVSHAQAELPAASQARLRQIVPFSLEESLADDIEQLSFAIGTRRASGVTPVAAVAKQTIDKWLAELGAAGIVPQTLCSEADGVPEVPSTLVLLVEAGLVYGRYAERAPFVLEGPSLREVVDLVGSPEQEAGERHLLVYASAAERDRVRNEVAGLGGDFASVDVKIAAEGLFPHLAATLAQRAGTNLLQGAYAPKSNWSAFARPWRFAAALLVAAAALLLVSQGAEYWQLRRSDDELTDLVSTNCQRIVGDSRPSTCQRIVQQRLGASAASSGGSEDFLSTLAAIAAARDPEMRIDALSYRNRVMDLQLVASSVPALDEFARGLQQTKRFGAEIQAANQRDTGTEGRVRVTSTQP